MLKKLETYKKKIINKKSNCLNIRLTNTYLTVSLSFLTTLAET